jgi:hypothetical protein
MESVGIPGSPELIGLASCPPGGSPIGPVGPCPTWDPTCSSLGGPGGGTPQNPGTGDCNPLLDPNCYQPLTSADSASIATAIQRHRRPASQFTDPAKAQQCSQLMAEFDRLFRTGMVFRGGSDTPPNDPHTEEHVGAWDPIGRKIHFERSALDKANQGNSVAIRELFNTALHEAAHALNFSHTPPWTQDCTTCTRKHLSTFSVRGRTHA